MTDIDRFYNYHGGKPEEEPYEKLSEDEAKMLAKYYYEEVTIEDYRTLYDAYKKVKSEKNKYFNSYIETLGKCNDQKLMIESGNSNFLFMFLFAFSAAMFSIVYLDVYINFSAILWRSAIVTILTAIIGGALKFIYNNCSQQLKPKMYAASYIIVVVLAWLINVKLH